MGICFVGGKVYINGCVRVDVASKVSFYFNLMELFVWEGGAFRKSYLFTEGCSRLEVDGDSKLMIHFLAFLW